MRFVRLYLARNPHPVPRNGIDAPHEARYRPSGFFGNIITDILLTNIIMEYRHSSHYYYIALLITSIRGIRYR